MSAHSVPQTLIAERFMLSYRVGSGGGGSVYKAFDLLTKQYVAIKFLHTQSEAAAEFDPFIREAKLLQTLHHPGIVAYVAHGKTPDGSMFLALEWLEGDSLAIRLLPGPLSVEESIRLLRKVAEPLALIHERGIIHCDLKPNNLFLRHGLLDGTTLIDFGAARDQRGILTPNLDKEELRATITYVAPEVVRGQSAPTPAADIFALGCVLYECLTGAAPFGGGTVAAVIARLLFEDPAPLRKLRPEAPDFLAELLSRMLAKNPEQRPADAGVLLRELTALAQLPAESAAQSPLSAITSGEDRLVTIILAAMPAAGEAPAGSGGEPQEWISAIHSSLSKLGAQIEQRADGSVVVGFPHTATTASWDQAERAVRSGLLLKAQWPQAGVAVTTGRSQFPQPLSLAEAVERATRLLGAAADETRLLVDEPTSRLVGLRLELVPLTDGVFAVQGERDELDGSRPLLGQPTPCVGRESELALLQDTLRVCITQRVARAVIVTGPPGGGKSRLRHEFWRRTQAQHRDLTALFLRGDQMLAGSPFAVAGQALRRLFAVSEADAPEVTRGKLLDYLAACGLGGEVLRVAEMLGEVCGVQFPHNQSARLLTARHDPRVMMEQVSQAWVELLGALAAKNPVVLMLEDVHHADALSVALIGTALRELGELPLMVLALARTDVDEIYPRLWLDREPQIVRLGTLGRKACERLVRHVLGAQLPPEAIGRIIEQSSGNALCLEELIRDAAESKHADVPHTILLMLQARLLRLPAEQRRTLRAASLFGEVFWRGGVVAMLGADYRSGALEDSLSALIEQELIERQPDSRFPQEQEFRFRHVLVREAALSLMTAADRTLGHRIAAHYLEAVRERSPMILAEHFFAGEQASQALPYYLAAAEQALAGCDLEGAVARVRKALLCGPSGETLGALHGVALAAHFWRDEWQPAIAAGVEALALLPPGTAAWCRAAAIMIPISTLSGLIVTYDAIAATLSACEPEPDACRAYVQAASHVVIMSSLTSQSAMATKFRQCVQRHSAAILEQDLAVVGHILFSETVHARMLGHDPWRSYRLSVDGAAACQQAGDLRTLLFLKGFEAIGLAELGDPDGAEQILQAALVLATQLREPLLATHVRVHIEILQLIRGRQSDIEAAYESARQSVETAGINPLLRGQSLINLARAQLLRGQLTTAEDTARDAASLLAAIPAHLVYLAVVLIECLVQQGRLDDAAAAARRELARIAQIGSGGYAEVALLRIAVLALRMQGAKEEALQVLAMARAEVRRRADCIPEGGLRERYLSMVAENRQVVNWTLS